MSRVQTSVRYPEEIIERVDKVAGVMRDHRPAYLPPTMKLNRSEILLLALDRGLKLLEAEMGPAEEKVGGAS